MTPRSISRSLRIPTEIDDKVGEYTKDMDTRSVTDSYLIILKLGLRACELQKELKEKPERKEEISKAFDRLLNEETIFGQAERLSETQMEGIAMALELERERRKTWQFSLSDQRFLGVHSNG